MAISQPFRFDATGRTATAEGAEALRQAIETVLFTQAGERVNRPDFGSGLFQLIFAPNGSEIATATQFLVQSALQRWLGARAQVLDVQVAAEDAVLTVVVRYQPAGAAQPVTARFARAVPA
ncbi:GPW/gp25 family protein [Roseomonas populi]|uniref:GPW/gp25 family protein n=1 Tax=Roseomonas populi TaxID=3121582 RepID=A0ABT1X6Z5_9PROT|nr:GPW/gp25 family protein [Roseomonas pecuniae]MCR0982759.1 GPW/gp25 family protein [Roseomonas pecuniae]